MPARSAPFLLPAISLALTALLTGCASDRRSTPGEVRIVTEDVARFYETVARAPRDATAEQITALLREDYFGRGTPGLTDFVRLRIESPELLARTYLARREYYHAVREPLRDTIGDERLSERVTGAFEWIAARVTGARFPDVYVVIGRMNSAGTTSGRALLIGGEMFGRTEGVPLHELSDWARENIAPPSDLARVIVHESIHSIQPTPRDRSLLMAVIREGACDFVAMLALGETPPGPALEYARRNLSTLWPEFASQMHGTELGEWLYTKPQDADRPTDLGYAIGYLICEAYYARAADKDEAVRAIITTTDPRRFLRESGFDPRSR